MFQTEVHWNVTPVVGVNLGDPWGKGKRDREILRS